MISLTLACEPYLSEQTELEYSHDTLYLGDMEIQSIKHLTCLLDPSDTPQNAM